MKTANTRTITPRRIVAAAMALICAALICMNPLQTMAATSGYGTGGGTIHVETKADWRYPGSESITLQNHKVKFTYSSWSFFKGWQSKTRTGYPVWEVSFRSTDGSHRGYKEMKGGSLKLNLKRNKYYIITISYGSFNWTKGTPAYSPHWNVKSTHKASCR